jgi:ribosomal protein S18 acetylase RimI-like enzyme
MPDEKDSVRTLVQTVVDEIYGGIWAPPPLPIDNEDWSLAWIATSEIGIQILGMVLTHEEWISDLWVLAEYRGRGVGRTLLVKGESEIAARGHKTFRLRVVKSNTTTAINFYRRQGWRVEWEFPHERLPTTMLEMIKPTTPNSVASSRVDLAYNTLE